MTTKLKAQRSKFKVQDWLQAPGSESLGSRSAVPFLGIWSLALLLIVGLCSLSFGATSPLAGKRPNIFFVLCDDQGYGDISAHGNPILKTPNMDRLHHEGVRFTDFHVSPTCSPTRSALLTVRHEFRNGVTHTILER